MKSLLLLAIAATCFGQESLVTLKQWRMQAGDTPGWAKPDFDDSNWKSSQGPISSAFGQRLPGVLWYRTTVPAPSGRSDLAIGFGPLDECYQVFVQGELIGQFGQWGLRPEGPAPRHAVYPIPARIVRQDALHIAVRRFANNYTPTWLALSASGNGRFRHSPVLGSRLTLENMERLHIASGQIQNLPWNLTYLMALVAALLSFAFYSTQRTHREYLLLGLYCLCFSVPLLAIPVMSSESVMTRSPFAVFTLAVFVMPFVLAILILAILCPRYRMLLYVCAAVIFVGSMGAPVTLATHSPMAMDLYRLNTKVLPFPYLIALWGLRREGSPGTMLIAATLSLFSITDGWSFLTPLRTLDAGPFRFDIRAIGQVIFLLTTMVVFYRRFRDTQIQQALVREDLAAARRIQEHLLNTRPDSIPGFAIDAVHYPAREVGGDFHQELPGDDGSLLVVVGDVSGKGLPAAMLVSTVVGALGDLASRRPADVLSHLNRALIGKTSGGFVTCCCLLLQPDGRAVVANAGHIPPYLDGEPVDVDSGLPLGIAHGGIYAESTLCTGGRFTMLSDGVIEAANASDELFGFDRTRHVSTQTARAIAQTAQAWGQNDDITVVTVGRAVA